MKLIDKDVVFEKIKKRLKEHVEQFEKSNVISSGIKAEEDLDVISCLDTLEVKEVDMRRELENFIEHANAWIKDNREVEYNNGDSFNHIYDLEKIAKHFYELGLKAQIPISITDMELKWMEAMRKDGTLAEMLYRKLMELPRKE